MLVLILIQDLDGLRLIGVQRFFPVCVRAVSGDNRSIILPAITFISIGFYRFIVVSIVSIQGHCQLICRKCVQGEILILALSSTQTFHECYSYIYTCQDILLWL